MSFVDVFTGDSVSPADISYRAVALTADQTLVWPTLSGNQAAAVARIMDVTPTAGGFTITMPDAREVSVGMSVLFFNPSAFTFSVLENDGSALVTVPAGQYRYVYLTDNTTQGGSWGINAFGVGASSPDAAALAGFGIKAIGATLNQKQDTIETAVDTTVTASDRASLIVFTGGSNACDLPLTATVGNDFFIALKNSGSGTITVTPAGAEVIDEIDGGASLSMVPDESFILQSNGAGAWYTIGRGRPVTFAFSQLVKNIAPGGTTTLTSTEAANKIIQVVGVLTSDAEVVVPNIASIYWTFNNTTGAFTVTFKTAAGTGIAVQQGTRAMLLCDATNVVDADDNPGTGVGFFPDGSEAAPGIAFSAEPTTGIRREGAGAICITGTQTDIHCFTAVAVAVNQLRSTNAITGGAPALSAEGADANIVLALTPKGTGGFQVGVGSVASGTNSISIGSSAGATATRTIAIGNTATAAGSETIVIGDAATATNAAGARHIVIGDGANTNTANADVISIGTTAAGGGARSVSIGQAASATGQESIAIGDAVTSTATGAVAIGDAAAATGTGSIAIGLSADATAADAVAVGENAQAVAAQTIAIGSDVTSGSGVGSISIGDGAVGGSGATNSIAIGVSASTGGGVAGQVAFGNLASATGVNSVAIGTSATTGNSGAVSIGVDSDATSIDCVALGEGAQATADQAIAIGSDAAASGTGSIAIGDGAATGANTGAVAIGTGVSPAAVAAAMGTSNTNKHTLDSTGKFSLTGTGAMFHLPNYTVATLPTAANLGGFIYVTDETGGAVPAFSDGTDWRRVTDRNVVS